MGTRGKGTDQMSSIEAIIQSNELKVFRLKMSPFSFPSPKAKQVLEIAEAGQRLIDHWPDNYEGGRVGGGWWADTYVSHPFLFYQFLQCEAQFAVLICYL